MQDLNNRRITTEREQALARPGSMASGTGIHCAAGCGQISDNVIDGLFSTPNNGCLRSCRYTTTGIVLSSTNALVNRNQISGGCGNSATGIQLSGGAPRLENNAIGGGAGCLPDAISSYGISIEAGTSTAADVHSNSIYGGGSGTSPTGCRSAGVSTSSSGGIFRNNIFESGACATRYAFEEQSTGAPSIMQNNDFLPGGTALYLDGGFTPLSSADAINALPGPYSANFSAPAEACVDRGTTEGAPADDIDAEPRSREFPDVGANESRDLSGPCAGIDCAWNGICYTVDSEPRCFCRAGFETPADNPLSCVAIATHG